MSTNGAGATGRKRALVFSFHIIGFGARKATMVFWAERLAAMGWDTDFVTVQLSELSVRAKTPRIEGVPRSAFNVWRDAGPNFRSFIWVPPVHPFSSGKPMVNRLSQPLAALYPRLLPKDVLDAAAEADLIVIESTAAVALFGRLKELNPRAKFVYAGCDPLDAIGMHPHLGVILERDAPRYDLVTAFSPQLLDDFADDVNTLFVPQGLETAMFEVAPPSPYPAGSGPTAVIAGDMMFDADSVRAMVEAFRDVAFHVFGCSKLGDLAAEPNVIDHGETPFERLRDFILHADVGLAPYLDRPDLHYLAESSMKLQQYTYARLPIVAPYFCTGVRNNVCAYQPNQPETAVPALRAALGFDRATVDRASVADWSEVMDRVLEGVGLAATPVSADAAAHPEAQSAEDHA